MLPRQPSYLWNVARRKRLYQLTVVAIGWSVVSQGSALAQTRVDGYLRELNNLDDSRPESTCIARDSLRKLILESDIDEREKMFRAFRAFYSTSVRRTDPPFVAGMAKYVNDYEQWLLANQAGSMQQFLNARPDVAEAGSRWFKCGFSMYDAEGTLYPMQDSPVLLSFANKLGPGLASYIRFRAQEDREIVIGDAAIQISWEELRLKLQRWEAFERGHQQLPEANSEMEPFIRALALLYLFGSDNTPTFNSQNGRIDPKLIASWSKFASHDPSSRYHELLSSLVTNVNAQNQTITQKDRRLFARFGMGDSFDQWWRLLQFRLTGRPHS